MAFDLGIKNMFFTPKTLTIGCADEKRRINRVKNQLNVGWADDRKPINSHTPMMGFLASAHPTFKAL